MDIQKGLVYQNTIISAKGARGAAIPKSKKFTCPLAHLVNMVPFYSQGNILKGL